MEEEIVEEEEHVDPLRLLGCDCGDDDWLTTAAAEEVEALGTGQGMAMDALLIGRE
jgi:hypothetical protein